MSDNGAKPLIEVESISKTFGSVLAVQDISMKVTAGEGMCLLGGNGAGQSTLIKMLSGGYQPHSGRDVGDGRQGSFSSPPRPPGHGLAPGYPELSMIPPMSLS